MIRTALIRCIQCDDFHADLMQRIYFIHAWRNIYLCPRILFFYNSYYREWNNTLNFFYIRNRICPDSFCTSLISCLCHPSHNKGRMKRFVFQCLTRYDQLSLNLLELIHIFTHLIYFLFYPRSLLSHLQYRIVCK